MKLSFKIELNHLNYHFTYTRADIACYGIFTEIVKVFLFAVICL